MKAGFRKYIWGREVLGDFVGGLKAERDYLIDGSQIDLIYVIDGSYDSTHSL